MAGQACKQRQLRVSTAGFYLLVQCTIYMYGDECGVDLPVAVGYVSRSVESTSRSTQLFFWLCRSTRIRLLVFIGLIGFVHHVDHVHVPFCRCTLIM